MKKVEKREVVLERRTIEDVLMRQEQNMNAHDLDTSSTAERSQLRIRKVDIGEGLIEDDMSDSESQIVETIKNSDHEGDTIVIKSKKLKPRYDLSMTLNESHKYKSATAITPQTVKQPRRMMRNLNQLAVTHSAMNREPSRPKVVEVGALNFSPMAQNSGKKFERKYKFMPFLDKEKATMKSRHNSKKRFESVGRKGRPQSAYR